MLGAENAEEREHCLLGSAVVPFWSFDIQVQECLECAFEILFAGELARFVIDDSLFALNVFLGDFGMEVEEFQKRFRFTVQVVAFDKLGEDIFCLCGIAETKTVTGVFSGAYGVNPLTGEKIPIWISEYVLAGYGTGAIMAVPAHDSRDYAFARHFDLPIVPIIEGCDVSESSFDAKEGKMCNSGFLNGPRIM